MKLILKNKKIIEYDENESFRFTFACGNITCKECPFTFCIDKKSYIKGTVKDMIKECKQGMKEKVKYVIY